MANIAIVTKYFPELSQTQIDQFVEMEKYYAYWNQRVNMISRKDFDKFFERHVLHSLAIAKLVPFEKGMHILDIGTGGGFPALPLCVYYPDVKFFMVDSIAKKIRVIKGALEELGLANGKALNDRAEKVLGKFDYITNRAVAPLSTLLDWTHLHFKKKNQAGVPTALLSLKGGDLQYEIAEAKANTKIHSLSDIYREPYFETKVLLETRR